MEFSLDFEMVYKHIVGFNLVAAEAVAFNWLGLDAWF